MKAVIAQVWGSLSAWYWCGWYEWSLCNTQLRSISYH